MIRNNPYGLKAYLNVETMSVDFKVINKNAKEGENPVVETESFRVAEVVHANLHKNVALYGLSKLLQDRSSDVQTGPGKLAAMREVAELLQTGEWERERKVGAPVVRPEVEALAEIKGCSVADIQNALRKYDKVAREKILENPAVVARAAAIRSKREATQVDLSDLSAA